MVISERIRQLSGNDLCERRSVARQIGRQQWPVQGQHRGDQHGIGAPDRRPATGDAAVDKVEAKRQSHNWAQRPVKKKPSLGTGREDDRSK